MNNDSKTILKHIEEKREVQFIYNFGNLAISLIPYFEIINERD